MTAANALVALTRAAAPVVSRLAPPLADRWLARLFTTPTRRPPLSRELPWLEGAVRGDVAYDEGVVMPTWSWGEGPTVLLMHGWSGRGSQMGAFVAPMVEAGFRVLAFDAPGHGDAGGSRAGLPIFTRAIERVAEAEGPLYGIVAHSLGTGAATFAFAKGVRVERAVYLAPPEDLPGYLHVLGEMFGFASDVAPRAQALLERRFGARLEDARGSALAPDMTTPLLVIHDERDREVPHVEGARIADLWPGAELTTTAGLGHRRIVRAPEVVEKAVRFLAAEPAAPTSRVFAGARAD